MNRVFITFKFDNDELTADLKELLDVLHFDIAMVARPNIMNAYSKICEVGVCDSKSEKLIGFFQKFFECLRSNAGNGTFSISWRQSDDTLASGRLPPNLAIGARSLTSR